MDGLGRKYALYELIAIVCQRKITIPSLTDVRGDENGVCVRRVF
jgi:hypothetical protein